MSSSSSAASPHHSHRGDEEEEISSRPQLRYCHAYDSDQRHRRSGPPVPKVRLAAPNAPREPLLKPPPLPSKPRHEEEGHHSSSNTTVSGLSGKRSLCMSSPLHMTLHEARKAALPTEEILRRLGPLLERGCDANETDEKGTTSLQWASHYGMDAEVCYALIRGGANVNTVNMYGHTAIRHAVSGLGSMETKLALVKLLLLHGADPNIPDQKGFTPLHCCADLDLDLPIFVALLESGADATTVTNRSKRTPLHLAASKGCCVSNIEALLMAGALPNDRDAKGFTPFHLALMEGVSAEVLTVLLQAGGDPTLPTDIKYFSRSAFHLAVLAQAWHLVQVLLEHRVDPDTTNARGDTALHVLALGGEAPEGLIEKLVQAGADPNKKSFVLGKTPLHLAVGNNGPLSMVKALLANGADPRLPDDGGHNPLHASVHFSRQYQEYFNYDIMKCLIEAGAEIDAPPLGDVNRQSPLMQAILFHAPLQTIQTLLEGGANPNLPDANGHTPIRAAVISRRRTMDLVTLLMKHGGVFRRKPKEGTNAHRRELDAFDEVNLALHFLLGRANVDLDVVALMLKDGCEPSAFDLNGHNALHVACLNQSDPKVVEMLLQTGVDPNEPGGPDGRTALHMALKSPKRFDLVPCLLAAGANPNARTSTTNMSVLEYVCSMSGGVTPEIIEVLLEAGADPGGVKSPAKEVLQSFGFLPLPGPETTPSVQGGV